MLPEFQSSVPVPHAPAGAGDVVPTTRKLAAGQTLFREGEPRNHVYRVETGSICIFKERADGSRDVLEFAFPGDLVGLGYLDNHVSGAQAAMDTSLSCLPRSLLADNYAKTPSAKARLTAAIEREVAFLADPPVQRARIEPLDRIAALFVTLARCNAYEGRDPAIITDSMTCGVIAGYLELTLDDLARHLKEMEARGLIEAIPPGLRLIDMGALERLADTAD